MSLAIGTIRPLAAYKYVSTTARFVAINMHGCAKPCQGRHRLPMGTCDFPSIVKFNLLHQLIRNFALLIMSVASPNLSSLFEIHPIGGRSAHQWHIRLLQLCQLIFVSSGGAHTRPFNLSPCLTDHTTRSGLRRCLQGSQYLSGQGIEWWRNFLSWTPPSDRN